MKIEKEIGDGKDFIYVYYNENDKKLASLEGQKRWECKIGFTSVSPQQRIDSQKPNTSMAREPILGLLIRVDNGYFVESWLHKELYQHKIDRFSKESGDEWFLTSPEEVEYLYLNKSSLDTKKLIRYCEYNASNALEFGLGINFHRKKVNLTSEKLSEMTGVSRDTMWRLTKGDPNISLSTVLKMADILDLEVVLKSRLPTDEIQQHKSASDRKVRRF